MKSGTACSFRARLATLGFLAVVGGAHACMEVPPKLPAIPASGLALRVYAFGASAQDARRAFEAVHQNNTQFTVVNQGGDGEVIVGLENDSPKCVAPTALCSFKISYRVRDNKGEVLHAATTTVSTNSDRCSAVCSKALVDVAVTVVEAAAAVLRTGAAPDGGVETTAAVGARTAGPPPKALPAMCSVGSGPRLPAEEAEKRAAQVEVLKRLSLLDQEEYDCLRKAYLARL